MSADAMRPSTTTTASKRLIPPSESQSRLKKSKRSQELTPWPSKSKTNIDDLPDVALVEIFSRLPHSKLVFQCKCVCKRWSSLISDEEFQCRFLGLQSLQNGNLAPIGRTLIFKNAKDKREFFILPELELPLFKTHNFSMRFLPCFEAPEYIETDDDEEPVVVGMYNDLVLCCETMLYQRDYYICNPYTKKFVHIPPTPQCHKDVRVGFICDPFYEEQADHIQVNFDFRFAIVRIVPTLRDQFCSASRFHIEIFNSENGRWTQTVVNSPRYFCLDSLDRSGGIAYNGMVYWWSAHDGCIIGLDPYYYSSNKYNKYSACFHSIDSPMPQAPYGSRFSHLSTVCQGERLRFCQLIMHHGVIPSICVWELKDDKQWCNLTGNISLSSAMVPNHHLLNSITVLAFDPSNEDTLYMKLFDRIVTCNIRESNLKETNIPYNCVVRFGRGVFTFVLPRWPTPLPKLKSAGKTKVQLLCRRLESAPKTCPWPAGKSKTSIADISDPVLVEILCRLPHNKFVFQCKGVSKLWSSLISDEKFRCRFLWLNRKSSVPLERTLIFRDAIDKKEFFILPELELPLFKTHNFSLRFLPCFTPHNVETADYLETDDDEPIVLGACNDLVLCCATSLLQRDYYICNPYTKQYARLPPTPRCYREVRVGFICDPYYKHDDQHSTRSGTLQVDNDFRYAIVRICSNSPLALQGNFNVEIFSSLTGKWTESVVRSTREEGFPLNSLNRSGGIVHNGMLYWLSSRGRFIIGLDPYCSLKSYSFDLIGLSEIYETEEEEFPLLSVCRGSGRLQICHVFIDAYDEDVTPFMSVWELKHDDDDQGGRKWCNITGAIDISRVVFENPIIESPPLYESNTRLRESLTVLAFDPNNDDVLYLELFSYIVAFNIQERKIKETTFTGRHEIRADGFGRGVFPFVLPRWPTPVPKLRLD